MIYIVHRAGYSVKRASINDPDISDKQIDDILWAFFEDWDIGVDVLKQTDVERFLSINRKIGELFIKIDSDKAMIRCHERLDLIIQSLIDEHIRNTKRKTRTEL